VGEAAAQHHPREDGREKRLCLVRDLVSGWVEVGERGEEQIPLDGVRERWHGTFERLARLVENLALEELDEAAAAATDACHHVQAARQFRRLCQKDRRAREVHRACG